MVAQLGLERVPVVESLGYEPRCYATSEFDQAALDYFVGKHSISGLVATWNKKLADVQGWLQVIPHRLLNDFSRLVSENSREAGRHTIEAGFGHAERDVSRTSDGKFVGCHPKRTPKVVEGDGCRIELAHGMLLTGKNLVVREIKRGQFTGESKPACGTMALYEDDFLAMAEARPGYTEFADARDDEAAPFMAFIRKKLPDHLQQIVIQIHAHKYHSYRAFRWELRKFMRPKLGWQKEFCICLVLTAETLIKLACARASCLKRRRPDLSLKGLIAVGKRYLRAWLRKKWRFLSIEFAISEAATWLCDDNVTAMHPGGHVFRDQQVISEIIAIKALAELNSHYSLVRPDIFRMATQRRPDFIHEGMPYFSTLADGSPKAWPEKGTERRYLLDAMAEAGYMIQKVDGLKTDDPVGCIELIHRQRRMQLSQSVAGQCPLSTAPLEDHSSS